MAYSGDISFHTQKTHGSKSIEILHNLLVALTVSFVALSLGAAFGVLSGRGAFAGMFSAGLIAAICGALGGTRVQCSGPVAPMAAVMAGIFAAATTDYGLDPMALGGVTPDHFLNIICFICGIVMILMAVFRTGFLISYVPDSVISGFMTGISLIIWIGQTKFLFGLAGTTGITGSLFWNIAIVILTIIMTFVTYPILKKISEPLAKIMPGTLMALIVTSLIADVFVLDIQHVSVDATIPGFQGFVDMVKAQIPQNVSMDTLWKALPSGIEFALISYLDTLMVALIIDRMRGETTRKNKEIFAQGVANTAVGFIGGVPGTQASIRSVMMTKEGATMRMAGIMVGVFVIIEMLMFQDWLALIPQAVFVGILMKVGWNVCDHEPIVKFITRKKDAPSALDFFTIIGTALVTVYSLTLAVLVFTGLYYVISYAKRRHSTAQGNFIDNAPADYADNILDQPEAKQ
jgi:sulfate permease, SulP family